MTGTRARKADAIVATIEARILNGDYRPGTSLDERSLAEEFGVSRTPIREALLHLIANGLTSENGRGSAVVRQPTVSVVLDAFLVVSELEGLAARQAARRITPGQLQDLEAANAACKRAAEAGDVDGFNAANMQFHDLIIVAAQNQLLAAQLKSTRVFTFPYRHFVTRFPGYMRGSVDEHSAICNAIRAGEAEAAHRQMHAHVNLQGEQITDLVRQIELDAENRTPDPLHGSA
jgi:DNA-binding GntR family transcriptional regulator